ncbi:MAG: hypothetical protein ACRC1T_05325 [Clostridium chrysemydis]|uniref:hypothetical protein n=1 Tax=Clostridium chrysemydis TaxID=2665504 RepID=UPI003F307573
MYKCWYCQGDLIWQSDADYEDVYAEGNGIITYLKCLKCGADIEYSKRKEEEYA